MNAPILNRRSFGKGLGGIVLAFALDPPELLAQGTQPARLPGSLNNNRMLDAWIRIAPNGIATVFTGKVELGQGILTALSQIAAEELDLPLSRVKMISGDTGQTPNEGQTAGSQSIENSGTALRMAAAEVRGILLELAEKRLGVASDKLSVADGVITAPDGHYVYYGALAATANFKREATAKVVPKSPADYKIVGKSIPRLDIPAKVTGGAAYVQDMRPAGMLHGRVVRPPRYGSTLANIDDAAVKATPGVIAVVRDGSFLGVIADREETAVSAREALAKSAKWNLGPELPDPDKIYEHLKSLPSRDEVIGLKEAPLLAGGRMFQATYTRPYTAHASMGLLARSPNGATANCRFGPIPKACSRCVPNSRRS